MASSASSLSWAESTEVAVSWTRRFVGFGQVGPVGVEQRVEAAGGGFEVGDLHVHLALVNHWAVRLPEAAQGYERERGRRGHDEFLRRSLGGGCFRFLLGAAAQQHSRQREQLP